MPRVTAFILTLIGAGAVAAGGYAALYPGLSAADAAFDQQTTALQRVAETACRCERRSPTKNGQTACWAKFDKLLPPGGEMMTACDPVSETGRCGKAATPAGKPGSESPFDSGPCVTTHYDYTASTGETILLCSKDEARLVERAWNKEAMSQGSGTINTPIADQLARDIVAGKPRRPIDGPKSCTG